MRRQLVNPDRPCSLCGLVLPRDAYNWHVRHRQGGDVLEREARCRDCRNAVLRERRRSTRTGAIVGHPMTRPVEERNAEELVPGQRCGTCRYRGLDGRCQLKTLAAEGHRGEPRPVAADDGADCRLWTTREEEPLVVELRASSPIVDLEMYGTARAWDEWDDFHRRVAAWSPET